MKFFSRPRYIRTRLTLWYSSALASVLLLSWSLTATFLFLQLRSQLNHYAVQDLETVEGLLYFDAGRLRMREDYHNHPESKLLLERLLEIRSSGGNIAYRNDRLGNRALGGPPLPGEGVEQFSPRSERLTDGTRVHLISRLYRLDGHPLLIRLAYSEEPIWSRMRELATASLLALPLVLALSSLVGYLIARRGLAPLEEMACLAEQITSERLHERLPVVQAGDELGHLARVFNGLLARLEQSFEQLRRFTSDASHELRTPLTSIRSVGEVALQQDLSGEEYRDTIGSMLEEANRLTALVDNLLTISRADAGRIELQRSLFSALDLAREAAGLLEVLVEEKAQRIVVAGDAEVMLSGDRVLLRQALVNIMHNAVKYSPLRGAIQVRIHEEGGGSVCIEVEDSGPGIPHEHAGRIFDRFYRVDESRSREFGGAGLGLSIAEWAIKIHGGEISLASPPGAGCTFQMHLPQSVASA